MKYLIINADDFGKSPAENQAIIDLLRQQRISSATLMPNAPGYEEARQWCVESKTQAVGLHLTLTSDHFSTMPLETQPPHYRSLTRHKSLEDEQGFLFTQAESLRRQAVPHELQDEIAAQFAKLHQDGIAISHVDCHMYSLYPACGTRMFRFLLGQCRRHGRIPLRFCRESWPIEGVRTLYESAWVSTAYAALADLYNVPIPDYAYAFPYFAAGIDSYDQKKQTLIAFIGKLPEGISELHLHPATDSDELRRTNPTAQHRIDEYRLLLDNDIREALEKQGVILVSYRDIRRLAQDSRASRLAKAACCLSGLVFKKLGVLVLLWQV
jgi:predicted glycoside hydrolase/deacetylase ChbG (UPF0249 family)